jgi:hypothetical protein
MVYADALVPLMPTAPNPNRAAIAAVFSVFSNMFALLLSKQSTLPLDPLPFDVFGASAFGCAHHLR